ncbi:branched-chain amino acid transport system substrate-binding protein [Leucobacter exalbidus]|uniref:Branched-chain amino acid transport system substrate-binding protein n=1 Tax=Leucobacter exalbidus TaxID=662960 RepID=A0A940SZK5_9MICO|nr:ABC transporter substrate-binding protein [Leucobacter exalbidus]MBP1324990.1 branched-chain amino acid transport system substrate-binding protein [Leucobacter exalbidus]
MKVYSKKAASAFALMAGAALALSACSSGGAAPADTSKPAADSGSEASSEALRIGTLLPQTGSLEHLIYGPKAGVALAVKEINEAGGVGGNDVEVVVEANEHDPTDPTIMNKSVDEIIKANPAFVLGAMGTGNTNAAMPKVTEAGILMGSPSNTGIALAGINDLYFRTIASDIIQGRALGNLILQDGNAKVAVLAQNNDYGKGLRDNLQTTVEEAGGEISYGATGSGEEFPEAQTTFSSEVTAALATKPDAIAIVSYVEAKQAIPELAAQDFDLSKLYLVDGNTVPYPEFDAGLLEGAQGTTPGRTVDDAFEKALVAASSDASKSLNFAPEAYDAVMLVALAAQKGGATDTDTIVKNLHAVSGDKGGDECSTYADCLALLEDGKEIHYLGKAGGGPLNADNEPSTALIGIYKYDAENTPVAVGEIEG